MSGYLHFQQVFAWPLCKELPVSLKTPRWVPTLVSLHLVGKETERSACGGLHADPKGQSGKGSGGHLVGAPCVTEEETVAVQVKKIQATWSEGQWQCLEAGLLTPRPALHLPRHSQPRLYCPLYPAHQLGSPACHSILCSHSVQLEDI